MTHSPNPDDVTQPVPLGGAGAAPGARSEPSPATAALPRVALPTTALPRVALPTAAEPRDDLPTAAVPQVEADTQRLGRVEPATPPLGTPVTWGGPAREPASPAPRTPGLGTPDAPAPAPAPARVTSARLVPRVVALVTFAAFAVAFGQTVRIFLGTAAGQRFDELALAGSEHGSSTLWRVAGPVLDVVSVAFIAVAVVVVLVIAALRRAWGLGLQVAVLVAGANLTTQVLKHDVLERADLGVLTQRPGNSLPSGHTTVAASVAIALLLVVPRRTRPYVALLGAAWTAATGVSTLVGQWHRPSDVLAALLVVGAWTGLVVAFTPRSAVDRTSGGAISTTAGVVILGLGALAGAGFAVLTLGAGVTVPGLEADDVIAYAGSVAAVVGLTCVLFLVALQLRQEAARRPR